MGGPPARHGQPGRGAGSARRLPLELAHPHRPGALADGRVAIRRSGRRRPAPGPPSGSKHAEDPTACRLLDLQAGRSPLTAGRTPATRGRARLRRHGHFRGANRPWAEWPVACRHFRGFGAGRNPRRSNDLPLEPTKGFEPLTCRLRGDTPWGSMWDKGFLPRRGPWGVSSAFWRAGTSRAQPPCRGGCLQADARPAAVRPMN